MELKDYLLREKINQMAFALCIGISMTSLNRYKSKRSRPTKMIAYRIEKQTGGKVTMKELRDE